MKYYVKYKSPLLELFCFSAVNEGLD